MLLALMTASQVYLSMITHGHSFARILGWQLGAWAFWAITAPWVLRLAGRQVRLRVLIPLGVLLVAAHVVITTLLTAWTRPFEVMGAFPHQDAPYPFFGALSLAVPYVALIDPVLYLLLIVGGRALAAHEQRWRMQVRASQLESDLARAQLDALRLEIEPHFLFNTLNSIAAQIRLKDQASALSMLLSLSDLMRSTLDRASGQYTSLGDELALVARYVDLQRSRFNDRLTVVYEIDPACKDVAVPVFLLQPIVENALRHGLMPLTRPGRLEIGAACHHAGVRLWVRDDGGGLPPAFELGRSRGTGLRNIKSRIERIYGDRARFTVRGNEAKGTTAELILPRTAAPEAAHA